MITTADIEKLAQLARIQISAEEKESMRTDIESILEYVGQIKNIDVSGSGSVFASTSSKMFPVRNVMRADEVTHTPSQYTETLLVAAPSREGDYFKVKKIL